MKREYNIGVVFTASPYKSKQKYDEIKKQIENMGHKIIEGQTCFDQHTGFLAQEDEQRAKDLMDMFDKENIDLIIIGRGGYGNFRILPFLKCEVFRKSSKIIIGYSDVTALHSYLIQECNMWTIHGPVFCDLLEENHFFKYITKIINNVSYEIEFSEDNIIKKGISSGKIVGGNLTTIISLMGTPYELDTDNKILLLEDINEDLYKIDRMLTQLIVANKIKNLKGLILGSWTNCGKVGDLKKYFSEKFKDLEVPIIYNINIGHTLPNIPIPLGKEILITNQKIIIKGD